MNNAMAPVGKIDAVDPRIPGVTSLHLLGNTDPRIPQYIDCPFCKQRTHTRTNKEGTQRQL